jgi:hypothetical protein
MKTFLRLVGALVVALGIGLSSKDARALGPIGIEVGAKVGYGTDPGGANSPLTGASVNPLGVGLGGRAGITVFGIYLGGSIVDYLGSGDTLGGQYHALQYGGEIGYGFKILFLTLRPQIGLGNIQISDSAPNVIAGAAFPGGSSFYLEPGAVALLTFGIVYFGADINALIITAEPAAGGGGNFTFNTSTHTALTVHGQLGLSF